MKDHKCNQCMKSFITKNLMETHLQTIHLNNQNESDFGRVICNFCGKTFSTQKNMKTHVKIIHENGKQKCDICSKLISSYHLKKHTDTFHLGINRVECNSCKKSFTTKSDMKKHVKRIHMSESEKVKCEICSKFISRYYLKKHTETFHFGINKVECNHCNQYFTTKSDLKKHIKRIHVSEKAVNCGCCDKSFTTNHELEIHVKIMHMDNDYKAKCNICSKLILRNYLKQHIDSVHSDLKRVDCTYCNKLFATKSSMNKHVKRNHMKKKMRCEICTQLISSDNLKWHTNQFHNGLNKSNCSHCEKSFTTKPELEKHIKIIHMHMNNKAKCDICSKFFSSNYLKQHIDIVHSDHRRANCLYCNKSFVTKSDMKRHIKRIHTSEKEKCDVCSMLILSRNLKYHINQFHNGANGVNCNHCDKSFKTKHELEIHVTTIHMDMDYKAKCYICSKLISRNNLKQHIAIVHFDLKRAQCTHCDKSFTTNYDMKKHVQRIHIIGKTKCDVCSKLISSKYLKHHIDQFHHGLNRAKCSQCEKSFVTKQYMEKHFQTVHMNRNDKVECDKCEKVITIHSLKQHIDTVHLDIKRANCTHCEKSFTSNSEMNKHVKRVHLKDGKVKCDICLKLISSSYLKLHTDTLHHGINRVNCTYCEKNFITKSEMKIHVKSKHTKNADRNDMEEENEQVIKVEIGEMDSHATLGYNQGIDHETSVKVFQCLVCGEVFKNQVELINHVEDSHNIDETNIEDLDQNPRIEKEHPI